MIASANVPVLGLLSPCWCLRNRAVMEMMKIPACALEYTIRESKRARKVILKVSEEMGLEVVVPVGFDGRMVPRILEKNQAWLKKALSVVEGKRALKSSQSVLPETIHFRALSELISVQYRSGEDGVVKLFQTDRSCIEIHGDTSNSDVCRNLLKRWLKYQGQLHLIPWLDKLSKETGLRYGKAQIRSQKTRWGSCSSRGTISLNCNLLFFPPELVSYVMTHELCHTVHRDHSERFYSLLKKYEPHYSDLEMQMKKLQDDIPSWAR